VAGGRSAHAYRHEWNRSAGNATTLCMNSTGARAPNQPNRCMGLSTSGADGAAARIDSVSPLPAPAMCGASAGRRSIHAVRLARMTDNGRAAIRASYERMLLWCDV